MVTSPPVTGRRPGWPEIAVGLVVFAVLLLAAGLWTTSIPDSQATLRADVGLGSGGAAGIFGLLAAVALRIRRLGPFGFRSVVPRWLLIGAGLGVAVYFVNLGVGELYYAIFGDENNQGDFQTATASGTFALLATLVTGALLTPFGEEVLFRGVIANALSRYNVWVTVIAGALIFAVVHGINVISPLAFVVGVVTGLLFLHTGSIWPGVVLHVVYNGLNLLRYAFS